MEKQWYGSHFKLGVLGGGQLGRMLIQSALNYDVRVYCMDSSKKAPCGAIAHHFYEGNIKDYDDVMDFGKDKDVVTVEIEHVNTKALKDLEKKGVKVFPQPDILSVIQDKGLQKKIYKTNGIPTAPFELIEGKEELNDHTHFLPFYQKLRKGGYDGKGVYKISSPNDFKKAFDGPCVLEKLIDFKKELSIIVARNEKGEVSTYPLVECEFNPELNLVEFLFSPADVSKKTHDEAKEIATKLIQNLGMVGVLAVELFLTKDGELLVNEIAPRTHNSGHHTIECNITSQFEQHLRAITNQSLGDTSLHRPGVMINLLGAKGAHGKTIYEGISKIIGIPGVYPHLYGKEETKPHRKMGHVTIVADDLKKAKQTARKVKNSIRVVGDR